MYALGAILYECLTGRPPFKAASKWETIQQVLTIDPVPPRQLNPALARDVETICLQCLRKEPGKRYASALELAEDLKRFREGRPVKARPIGTVERAAKWVRRNPVPTTAVAIIVAIAVVAFALISSSRGTALKLAHANGLLAEEKGRLAEEKGTLAEAKSKLAEKEVKVRQGMEKALNEKEQERKAKEAELLRARSNTLTGQLLRVKAIFERDPAQALPLLHDCNACPLDLRDTAWHFYDRACHSRDPVTLATKGSAFYGAAFLPDGTLVSANLDGMIGLWDLATGKERPLSQGKGLVTALAIPLRGGFVAARCGDVVCLWEADTGKERGVLPHPGPVRALAVSGDGKALVCATSVSLRAVRPTNLVGLAASGLSTSPLLLGSALFPGFVQGVERGSVSLWDPATLRQRANFRGNGAYVWSVAISPDGQTVACGEGDQVRLWDVASGREKGVLKGHNLVWGLAFTPDSKVLATGDQYGDGSVRFWNVATGALLGAARGQRGSIRCLAFSPNGQYLAIGKEEAPFPSVPILAHRPPTWCSSSTSPPDGWSYSASTQARCTLLLLAPTDGPWSVPAAKSGSE